MSSNDEKPGLFSTVPKHLGHNFHSRVGIPPQHFVPDSSRGLTAPENIDCGAYQATPVEDAKKDEGQLFNEAPVESVHGFPEPGEQSPRTVTVMNNNFFVPDETWANLQNLDDCDYLVIGSGCTALAFIEEALRLDPMKKILCLERGDFMLPSHFQNLPLPFNLVLGGDSETFPFTLSKETVDTKELGFCHGSCPFFGGRSSFWSAWCPRPSTDLMRNYAPSLISTVESEDFWVRARDILNVTSAADIKDGAYGDLQKRIGEKLDQSKISQLVPTADLSEAAQLAVGAKSPTSSLRFNKLSTSGPLLECVEKQRAAKKNGKGEPLMIRLNSTAVQLKKEGEYVSAIQTNDKVLQWKEAGNTKVILCAGAFPNATLLFNSIPDAVDTVGKRLTGHFLSHIVARVPLKVFGECHLLNGLEIAAHYVAGQHPVSKLQYHVQITAIHSPNPEQDAEDAARECPDYAAAATKDQLMGSEEYVVFVCATLGEFTENNPNSFLRRNLNDRDLTTNVFLQYTLANADRELWDTMDQATYETIEAMSGAASEIEYWCEGAHGWIKEKPATKFIRVPGIVHEASVSYVGEKENGGSLDSLYRPHGVKNLFVTGAGILPTAGSWNPTLTICGYAQDLARRLHESEDCRDN